MENSMYKKLKKLIEEHEEETRSKELENEIIRCWSDPEFATIRNLFREFLIGEGHDSEYLNHLAYLMGIDKEGDGWGQWWGDLDDISKAKYIRL